METRNRFQRRWPSVPPPPPWLIQYPFIILAEIQLCNWNAVRGKFYHLPASFHPRSHALPLPAVLPVDSLPPCFNLSPIYIGPTLRVITSPSFPSSMVLTVSCLLPSALRYFCFRTFPPGTLFFVSPWPTADQPYLSPPPWPPDPPLHRCVFSNISCVSCACESHHKVNSTIATVWREGGPAT